MRRKLGMRLKGVGCVVIVTVMLTDHFLFTIHDGFILAMAILSAIMLIAGIVIVRIEDARIEAAIERQKLLHGENNN